MKSATALSFIFVLLLVSTRIFGALITVDNNVPSIGQYQTLQAAHDAAVNNDIIYVYPSPNTYDGLTLTKKLQIYGNGWGLDFATSGICDTKAGAIVFNAGSEGSTFSGLEISGCNVNANDVKVSHCYITSTVSIDADNVEVKESKIHSINVLSNNQGIILNQNLIYASFITATYMSGSYGHNDSCSIFFGVNCSITVTMNIMSVSNNSFYCTFYGIFLGIACSGSLLNNTVIANGSNAVGSGSTMISLNNIFLGGISTNTTYWTHNILSGELSSLFVDANNGDYHLAPGSPAIGAGESGIDCGAYGGSSPFNDKYNTPELPTVIQLLTPTTIVPKNSPIPLTIKARTNQ